MIMKKIVLLLLVSIPFPLFASTSSDTDVIITQMKSILDQYWARVKALEAENEILRSEMMKAGIKIPLALFSGAVVNTTLPAIPEVSTSTSSTLTWTSVLTLSGSSWALLDQVASKFSSQYAGFIGRVQSDWPGIQWAYKIASWAYISGFEFVKKGNDNHVYVDITYATSTTPGIYDAKILYEYHTGTFQRKLVGFFEFDQKAKYYITKTGTNLFPGVERVFIANPYMYGAGATNMGSSTNTWATTSPTPSSSAVAVSTTMADIEKAYGDKRYLTAISLSNAYLQTNPPSIDILRIRYRTFFIIGKYSESLAEIAKIEALGKLDKAIACDAQVIATYSKNPTLVDSYTKICKK